MKILMVSPYPPIRDGIANYAVQKVAQLRAEGNEVEVLSPGPSAAHHHLNLVGPRGALALAKRVRAYDAVEIQFHPDFFYPHPASPVKRMLISLALMVAFRMSRRLTVNVHEVDYNHGTGVGLSAAFTRMMWRSADSVVVHTESERENFVKAFKVRGSRVSIAAHGAHFQRRTTHTRESARATLDIPADQFVFLAIGFIQPSKGFDRAIKAFSGLGESGYRIDVVGSVRPAEELQHAAYLNELRSLVEDVDGAHLHAGYISDELFDRWIVASDVVVLPYRVIWSSGVMERAKLYDRPVIASAVGGLAEQVGESDDVVLVSDDEELRKAMWSVVGNDDRSLVEETKDDAPADKEGVEALIRTRAARLRVPTAQSSFPRSSSVSAASVPIRRLPPLRRPITGSSRLGRSLVKKVVRRLLDWELEPIVEHVNSLQEVTVEALEKNTHSSTTSREGERHEQEV